MSSEPLISLIGREHWRRRLNEIHDLAAVGRRAGQAIRQRHVIELTIEKLRKPQSAATQVAGRQSPRARPVRPHGWQSQAATETLLGRIVRELPLLAASLTPVGRDRLIEQLRLGLTKQNTLIPLFHLVRTALLQRSRGFAVSFTGLEQQTRYDLLLKREQVEAEVACDVVTAEDGRGVHRGAWFRLADRIDPDLQTWLAAHPGRYLLKMTLPQGLRGGLHESGPDSAPLTQLHERITSLLQTRKRQDHDEAIVLRLDPLLLAGAQAEEMGLVSSLRREFGPEAHLSVTTGGGGVFVMAARAGQENEVAIAIRRRLSAIAPLRLTGERPGILSMFVEDTDRLEWRGLRERLELEGEARQFMTNPQARPVVAVTFASRLELFELGQPDAAPGGEVRFRNPAHPAAGSAALAPAVMSSV